jgi:hypothetical protein
MNLTRKQKAIYSGAALWLVWLLGFFVVAPIINVLLGVLYLIGWVLLLRFTNPQVQHLPPVERFGLGTDPAGPTTRPAPTDDLPSVIVPVDPEEQARLAEARREREAERAAERAEARQLREAAKTAEKDRKREQREQAEARQREQDEARAEQDRLEAEARARREADELALRQAEEDAARQAEALARREAEALARREAENAEALARQEAEALARQGAEALARQEAENAEAAVIDEEAVQSDQDILAASGVAALDAGDDADAESRRKAELLDKVRSRLHEYE